LQELASGDLCLPEAENHTAVSIGAVVSHADLVQAIAAVADIVASEPFARPHERLAIAEVKPVFDSSIIRLTARFEPSASGAGFEGSVTNDAGHNSLLGKHSPVCNGCAI